ncbi:hypothetical protein D3C72_2051260 [compost metagenome]
MPWAFNSKLVSVILLLTSNLSEASIQSKVSIEATIAMVAPTIQTLGFVNPLISGKVIIFLKSSSDCGTGKFTRCFSVIAKELPDILKNSFNKIPAITATNAPGNNFSFRRIEK